MTDSTTASATGPTATVTRRDVVRVAGPDAATYLQGQISQDVDALAVNTSTWTFVLQPQGKVDSWARITKVSADEFLLDLQSEPQSREGEVQQLRGRLRSLGV